MFAVGIQPALTEKDTILEANEAAYQHIELTKFAIVWPHNRRTNLVGIA